MEFWHLYRVIRKRLWMVLLLVVVTVSSTIFTVMTRPPSYKSTSIMRVAITSPSVSDIGRLDWYTAGILFSTIQETILSRTILEQVIAQNWLDTTVNDFRQSIGVTRIGNSSLVRIEVKSTEPEMAKRLANDIVATFIQYNQKLLNTQSNESIAFYEEQVKLAEHNYQRARDDFRNALNQPNARAAENQFIAAQASYQSAVDKLEAARLLNRFPSLRPASVAIEEPAVTPTEAEGRQLTRYVIIALLTSLLLGIFIAMGIEFLDLTIRSPQEVSAQLGFMVLGVIPHFRRGISGFAAVLANLDLPIISPLIRWRSRRLDAKIVPLDKLPTDATEAFRRARVNLIAAHRRRLQEGSSGSSTVLITSSRAGDGKTVTTVHLGIALARAGYRVLLIDANLRDPRLNRHFGLSNDGPGLVQVLEGTAAANEVIQPTAIPSLSVLLSRASFRTEPEILGSDRFSTLIDHLGRGFDFVLVDSPPLATFTDSAVLASQVTWVLLVLDATRPNFANETRSLSLLMNGGATVIGVVVNKINPDHIDPAKVYDLPRYDMRLAHDRNLIATNGHSHTPSDGSPAIRAN